MNRKIVLIMFLQAIFRKEYGFVADTIAINTSVRNFFRKRVKCFLIRHARVIIVPGRAGRRYFMERFGIDESRILIGEYALDGDGLAKRITSLRANRDVIRKKFKLADSETVFLMVANMIKTRFYPITTKAFTMAFHGAKARFVICGKGPELTQMQEYAMRHREIVVVPGLSFDEVLELYAIADVYVHGGTEPASTALVIGAIAGLPLISSNAVGCSADVLRDGKSGITVLDYTKKSDWVDGFERMMAQREEWRQMGLTARSLSDAIDVKTAFAQFVQFVEANFVGKGRG